MVLDNFLWWTGVVTWGCIAGIIALIFLGVLFESLLALAKLISWNRWARRMMTTAEGTRLPIFKPGRWWRGQTNMFREFWGTRRGAITYSGDRGAWRGLGQWHARPLDASDSTENYQNDKPNL